MPKLTCLPDNRELDVEEGETILAATLRADIPHAFACGGHAKCSTCRVWILEGLDNCEPRSEAERALTNPLGLSPEVRLACQTRLTGDVRLRRLVLDETDLEITSQLAKKRLGPTGESKGLVVMFCDIRGFTTFSENLSPYDVMFVLNRYFHKIGGIIENNGGYIDNFIGDSVMALFGIAEDETAPLRSVKAAVEMLEAIDRMKPYMAAMYGHGFEVGIGLHFGEAVIGTLGTSKTEKLTAIGDTVNVASRIEAANKEAGTRLLISEDLYELVKDNVTMDDFVRVKLRGTSERKTLYEISGVDASSLAPAAGSADDTRQRFAGLDWVRVLGEAELPAGGRKVVEMDQMDLLVIHENGTLYAMNNACPHLNLPLNDSRVTEDGGIVCRWHESCFDLATGEIRRWCDGLQADGTPKGMEQLGNISKNRRPLSIFPARLADGAVWVALDQG
ncbi:MAG: adenylate/guanylate cyclase domain-containing protein [Alphaproteobacteria bacterium]